MKDCGVGELIFGGRIFDNAIAFDNTFFEKPPYLYNATFSDGAIFPGKEYFKTAKNERDVLHFKFLRRFMKDRHDKERESDFFI